MPFLEPVLTLTDPTGKKSVHRRVLFHIVDRYDSGTPKTLTLLRPGTNDVHNEPNDDVELMFGLVPEEVMQDL